MKCMRTFFCQCWRNLLLSSAGQIMSLNSSTSLRKEEAMDPIIRVNIVNDCEWETQFIPWLEEKEMNNIGVEDGVFVATVDPALRYLQPADEDSFIKFCIDKKLTHVSNLMLKKYTQDGIFEFVVRDGSVDKLKHNLCDLDSFKSDNCCTPFLEQDDIHLGNLFTHLDSMLNRVKCFAEGANGCRNSRSRVMLEESALRMEETYTKFSHNTDGFTWENKQRKSLSNCPDMECFEDEPGITISSVKRRRVSKDESIDDVLCYGYGFESGSDSLQITSKLNMSRIFNILWLLPQNYPGLHSSYLYFGVSHAFFPIHVEDASTLSLNYLHIGKPKIWVFIPPWATELLEFHLHRSSIHLLHTGCYNVLGHKTILPTTNWLKARNIPFKVLVQRPGDLVVIYPNTAHFGFNSGPNIAQAINIATLSWIPYGINSKRCTCISDQIHIDILPLVAAFRKDLLGPLKRGEIIRTPAMLKGIRLLGDRIASSRDVYKDMPSQEQVHTVKCPARSCHHTISKFPLDVARKIMIKHVKSTHNPILERDQLLNKIHELLQG